MPLPERTGTANGGLPPRPAAIRMTLAMRPAECLAFGKLARDQVEIIVDRSPMASFTAWE